MELCLSLTWNTPLLQCYRIVRKVSGSYRSVVGFRKYDSMYSIVRTDDILFVATGVLICLSIACMPVSVRRNWENSLCNNHKMEEKCEAFLWFN